MYDQESKLKKLRMKFGNINLLDSDQAPLYQWTKNIVVSGGSITRGWWVEDELHYDKNDLDSILGIE